MRSCDCSYIRYSLVCIVNEICISITALGGTRPEESYDEANKRHTMSHPPDHIPDMDNMSPAKVRSPKDKKEKVIPPHPPPYSVFMHNITKHL